MRPKIGLSVMMSMPSMVPVTHVMPCVMHSMVSLNVVRAMLVVPVSSLGR
jgi:hypothetical protein